jgi:hypothetical protein
MNLCAARLGSGGLATESTLLLAAVAEFTTQGVCGWESFANAFEVLLGHCATPPFLDASTSRVVCEADERSVLVRVQVLRVGHGADTTLILLNIPLKESSTLGSSDRGVQAVATSALNAVVAESLSDVSLRSCSDI